MNSALPESTQEVEEWSEKFHDHELRKVLYDAAIRHRHKGEIRDAIKIVLLGWNWRAYAGESISNAELNAQVERFIQDNRPILEYCESSGVTLETFNFKTSVSGAPMKRIIQENFDLLLERPAIGPTGASKAYHMLYPDVFMMWDAAIIEAYHKTNELKHWPAEAGQGIHSRGSGKCYVAFLQETKKFIASELDMSVFVGESPAKVMDEYNYARFTLNSE